MRNSFSSYRGEGDLHERAYDHYSRSTVLVGPGDGYFSKGSSSYTVYMYPTDEWFLVYGTSNPTVAMIGAISIIIFTSILFFLYDFFVRKEFSAKKELLEAKRKFVRFVSHEVRTPLSSVVMGLSLLREEIGAVANGGIDAIASHGNRPVSQQQRASELPISTEQAAKEGTLLKWNSSGQTTSTMSTKELSTSSFDDGSRLVPCKTAPETLHTENHMLKWSDLANEVLVNAQSAVDVLNDLLNYDKVEMGTLSLELSVIPIWDAIEKTASEFKLSAAKKSISYSVDFSKLVDQGETTPIASATALPVDVLDRKAVGDMSRITQVLRNLLSNAIKFTPQEGKYWKIFCMDLI